MHLPQGIHAAADYSALAAKKLPAPLLAYINGGSGQDRVSRANLAAFGRWSVLPRLPARRMPPDCTTTVAGTVLASPVLLAPVAMHALAHERAERETADGADAVGACMVCSCQSSLPIETIATGSQPTGRWFQLLVDRERARTLALLRRAESAGVSALVMTVDAGIQVPSRRAVESGFRLPADLSIAHQSHMTVPASLVEATSFAPDLQDVAWLLEQTRLPVFIKGVLDAAEAGNLAEMGVAGVIVSNHGGRTIDSVPASLDRLPVVRTEVGDRCAVLLDGGIRSGSDVFKAIALGADAVLIGRLQLHALAVAGALGVAHLLRLLHEELCITMSVAGCTTLDDVRASQLMASAAPRNPQ